jgi:hypothetical protein
MWLLILGTVFVLVTVFMPKGIIGLPQQLQGLRRHFRVKLKPAPEPPPEPQHELTK